MLVAPDRNHSSSATTPRIHTRERNDRIGNEGSIDDRILQDAIETVTFDRAHFVGFGDSSLNFEIVFWVEKPEYVTFMDKTQEVNLAIMRRFAKEGVDFAYPTRTLFIAGPGGEAIDPREPG